MVDYAEKARKLREAIFDHAEQGHGGPCLRSGPLDEFLEGWLRANFEAPAPSYPYGERITIAAPGVTREELLKPEPAPVTHGFTHIPPDQLPPTPVAHGRIAGAKHVTVERPAAPDPFVSSPWLHSHEGKNDRIPAAALDKANDWAPDPTAGSITFADLDENVPEVSPGPMSLARKAQEILNDEWLRASKPRVIGRIPAGTLVSPELAATLKQAAIDALLYGTGTTVMDADGSHTHVDPDELARDLYADDADHIGFTQEERLHSIKTSWPTPAPSDPKRGDIYVDHVGLPSVWAGKSLGWQPKRTHGTHREMAPADAREFRAQYLADPTPEEAVMAEIADENRKTIADALALMKKRRGFTPD